MASYNDKTRLLVAKREDETTPMIIGAFPMSTWEIIPPEEYDELKRTQAEQFFNDDWTLYDYIEVVVTIPCEQLEAMFEAREVVPTAMEKGED